MANLNINYINCLDEPTYQFFRDAVDGRGEIDLNRLLPCPGSAAECLRQLVMNEVTDEELYCNDITTAWKMTFWGCRDFVEETHFDDTSMSIMFVTSPSSPLCIYAYLWNMGYQFIAHARNEGIDGMLEAYLDENGIVCERNIEED